MQSLYSVCLIILGINLSSNKVQGLRAETIVGGQEANGKDFKYVVAVMYKPEDLNMIDQNPCTGAIINDWYIAAVAHCFYDRTMNRYRNKEFYVYTSVTELSNPTMMSDEFRVHLVIMPKLYDPLELNIYTSVGNIAVVRLVRNLGLRRGHLYLKSIRLSRDLIRDLERTYTVAGFGWNEITSTNGSSNTTGYSDGRLRYATAKGLEHHECRTASNLHPGNICVKIVQSPHERKGICRDDSGSPLVRGHYLIGIAINGFSECNENRQPAVYIFVPYYYDFIKDVLNNTRSESMRILEQVHNNQSNTFEFQEV